MSADAPSIRIRASSADALFETHRAEVFKRTDRLFAGLMSFQWVAAIAGALWLTPRTWSGVDSWVHPHVWAALVVGTVISALPVYLALARPGEVMTRHVVAVGQMLMSALLIDVTGGRIETHFHVFGSLAFLAFYRDWKVLISATIVVAADHFIRGMVFPLSVYGIENASPWRWLEHAGWVVFEDIFLFVACRRGVLEMREIAERTAELQRQRDNFETAVQERTRDLAGSMERFRSISIASPVGIFETDAAGGCTYVNPRWQEISGFDLERTLGAGWIQSIHPDDREDVARRWNEYAQGGREWLSEHRLLTSSNEVRWVHARARALLSADGAVVGHVGTVEDITDRKRAEQERASLEDQLRQSQKMEAVGRLAGGIAHDFNNLLTAILGFGHLVKRGIGPDHEQKGSVDQIIRAGESAADLTSQLLAFSRRQVLRVDLLDLSAVVAGSAPMLERVIGEDIDFRTSSSRGLGMVRADRGQIGQVLMNLVVNARDAMPSGGRLTIETTNVELDARYASSHPEVPPGRYVMLAVSDTGVGMDAATRARVFEPFFSTKEMGRGTGLGLATVFGIVRQSDGHISVYSELGLGTTFKVYLPRADAAAHRVAADSAPDDAMPGGTETILLVEDETSVRVLAQSVLTEIGYRVLATASGGGALAAAEEFDGPIDLVLTDVVMPGIGGREVVERLAAARPGTVAIYMSGYTDDAVVRHGILEHDVAFLQKPFTPPALARKVRAALDGRAVPAVAPRG